ncbi:MAG: phosphoribosyltransferase [Pseudonocardiaceae bacterium]
MTTPTPTSDMGFSDARRVFEHRHLWRVTLPALAEAGRLLATAAQQRLGPISCVIGIANGGLVPATLIATTLSVPVYQVAARHNASADTYLPATGIVTCDLHDLAQHGRLTGTVLVVDDICGTGATLGAVLAQLPAHAVEQTRFCSATLCRNVGAASAPDLHCWDVADWVVFPWETPLPVCRPTTPLPVPSEVISRG